jgi:predicted nucleic acid-binding protein
MAVLFTVDASVFVNAFNPRELGHADSYRFLEYIKAQAFPIIVPTLLLPEIAAAISRGSRDADLARQFAGAISRLSHLMVVPLDATLAQQSAEVAADYHLRGSDAVCVAVALRFGSTLVTLDQEQLTRVASVLAAQRPVDILRKLEENQ